MLSRYWVAARAWTLDSLLSAIDYTRVSGANVDRSPGSQLFAASELPNEWVVIDGNFSDVLGRGVAENLSRAGEGLIFSSVEGSSSMLWRFERGSVVWHLIGRETNVDLAVYDACKVKPNLDELVPPGTPPRTVPALLAERLCGYVTARADLYVWQPIAPRAK